jgi:hypothetical protein
MGMDKQNSAIPVNLHEALALVPAPAGTARASRPGGFRIARPGVRPPTRTPSRAAASQPTSRPAPSRQRAACLRHPRGDALDAGTQVQRKCPGLARRLEPPGSGARLRARRSVRGIAAPVDTRGRGIGVAASQPGSRSNWSGEHVDTAAEAVSAALEVFRSDESPDVS